MSVDLQEAHRSGHTEKEGEKGGQYNNNIMILKKKYPLRSCLFHRNKEMKYTNADTELKFNLSYFLSL